MNNEETFKINAFGKEIIVNEDMMYILDKTDKEIYRLEQENKKLKEENEKLTKARYSLDRLYDSQQELINDLRTNYFPKKDYDELQQRIDKAIELLGLMKISEFNREMIETILKGDSNE